MERNGVGLATQSNAFDELRSVLLDAHRLGTLPDNPVAGDDAFMLIVDLMSGCGLRNGEAAAVNLSNIVADNVYRVTEQVILSTRQHGPLKLRKAGEYRDVPLPARVRETVEWYADRYGTVDGYLEGMVLYGNRHFFAS
ncbi:hypothetical protein [Streptomyces sp. NPDC001165]|uniref:hypothetical protein n=1 Tax=Streptomyces sp. NPDC001165 TaxID=3364546 RepID=UPI00367BA670